MHRCSRLRQLALQLSSCTSSAVCNNALPCSASHTLRNMSNLPKDYSNVKVVMPVRAVKKPQPVAQQSEAAEQASTSTSTSAAPSSSATSDANLRQGAQLATTWMFPWEKRQLDGRNTPLRTWEKLYWGVFVTAISLFLFNRLKPDKEQDKVDEDKEAKKLEAARAILAGRSFVDGDDDPFEGLGPKEIQEYIDKVLQGASRDDPFEGMSPEEINEYTQKHGVPAQYA